MHSTLLGYLYKCSESSLLNPSKKSMHRCSECRCSVCHRERKFNFSRAAGAAALLWWLCCCILLNWCDAFPVNTTSHSISSASLPCCQLNGGSPNFVCRWSFQISLLLFCVLSFFHFSKIIEFVKYHIYCISVIGLSREMMRMILTLSQLHRKD